MLKEYNEKSGVKQVSLNFAVQYTFLRTFNKSRVHFMDQQYWTANSEILQKIHLDGRKYFKLIY